MKQKITSLFSTNRRFIPLFTTQGPFISLLVVLALVVYALAIYIAH